MNHIMHDWNGTAIAQLTEATKIAKYDIPESYVNATQMCKACGKLFADYARLDSTKAYWKALSTEMGIPISGLVVTIKGGNNKHVQGTWAHPEIAVDLAQWVSIKFRIWANRVLRQQIISEQKPQPEVTTVKTQRSLLPTPQQISELFDLTLGYAGLEANLIAGAKLNAISKHYPELTDSVEEAKKLLPLPVENRLVTVSELAKLYSDRINQKISARAMNKLLQDKGLQEQNPESNPNWLPIGQGSEFASVVLQTAKGCDKTIQQLRWYPSVLEILENA